MLNINCQRQLRGMHLLDRWGSPCSPSSGARAWRGRSVRWWRRPLQRPVRPVQVAGRLRGQRARTRGAGLVCAMSRSGSFRYEPCHHASLCVWRQPCADEDLNLTHLQPERQRCQHARLCARTNVRLPPRRRLVWPLHAACFRVGLTPKFRGARLAWPRRAVVEASPATPS